MVIKIKQKQNSHEVGWLGHTVCVCVKNLHGVWIVRSYAKVLYPVGSISSSPDGRVDILQLAERFEKLCKGEAPILFAIRLNLRGANEHDTRAEPRAQVFLHVVQGLMRVRRERHGDRTEANALVLNSNYEANDTTLNSPLFFLPRLRKSLKSRLAVKAPFLLL